MEDRVMSKQFFWRAVGTSLCVGVVSVVSLGAGVPALRVAIAGDGDLREALAARVQINRVWLEVNVYD
jgi:hypothetical protein